MKYYAKPLNKLIAELSKLPGIGGKTAQRLAFHILSLDEPEAKALADAITDAKASMRYCSVCGNLTDGDICSVCADTARDHSTICVVESPRDVSAMERVREYKGVYHVLNGAISPMDGIGPEDINLRSLIVRLQENDVKEVILATNPTVEGDTTAMYIQHTLKETGCTVTRLASGLPVGGDLEYADRLTLARSFRGRTQF